MNLKKICLNYFNLFSNKNLVEIKKLLSVKVTLKDWDIDKNGINNVLKANEKIFQSVDSINVVPLNIYQNDRTLICELKIIINNKDTIAVVDIIKFNENSKIESIRAYKG